MLSCFTAYDIRGKFPKELNNELAWRIGRAYAEYFQPDCVVIGGDTRLSTPTLKNSLCNGLLDGGVNVLDIGHCGTEEVYFATFNLNLSGGIMITASHNPANYNGMKLVQNEARPVSIDSGLYEIEKIARKISSKSSKKLGKYERIDLLPNYINHLVNYIDFSLIKPLKIVVNAGHGSAGHVIDALANVFQKNDVPIEWVRIMHNPDGKFPSGVPNPMLPEQHAIVKKTIINTHANMGIAWDTDFDRCFLFDENGDFINGYYLVGLLSSVFLRKQPNSCIVHDPRLIWNTIDMINKNGGQAVVCKTGHSMIKEKMRQKNAIYGGEISGHHYFRDFAYCDSGMIPWLIMIEYISAQDLPLSKLINKYINAYPSTDELNLKLTDRDIFDRIINHYHCVAINIEYIDGISVFFENWRFNLRKSNTESLVRLNIETKGDKKLLNEKKIELLALLNKLNFS